MKKEMTIGYGKCENTDERLIVEMIAGALRIPGEWLRKYYSAILGRNVSGRLASLITRTQLAFVAMIVLAPQSALLGLAAAGCFAYALMRCRKEF